MSDDLKEVLVALNNAAKKGDISSEEKLQIKEMLLDGNNVVLEYADDYKQDKDEKKLIEKFKDYLKMFNEDDEDETNQKFLNQMASPEGEMLQRIKKQRGGKKKEDDVDEFANLEECEEGLSPKVVFNKK